MNNGMKKAGKIVLGIIAAILGIVLLVGGIIRMMGGDWTGLIWIVVGIGVVAAATVLIANGKFRDFFEIVNDILK